MDVPALQRKPKLPMEGLELVTAFNILSSLRTSNGFGHNPISLTDIKNYVEMVGQPFHDVRDFLDLLVEMDKHYLTLNGS